ncbi:LuxR family transcriptional regulatory protein [Yersinia enterocolitica]|uniref:helix-turn-helix transcriptional regulator n=1 Tax=Yersinia enterocolitica TaxID=630 RepID=UPI000281963C|nr:PAS and helix-turn-helix domain-containing protein [Yersinia enterocolitica]AJI83967.1 bacterial regulatory s, luxR family protein [Yersinia enterocolitica]EKA27915.1 LuxR family transcriptional regulatory protein [Yersinia enterocolitica subsp. enterocolitica WA-314]ELI8282196.1 PAS domain-containing protein [Yersinia enterocolitica]ELI8285410.1 PAS domain-containing protein [Yersinia enterocolitica]KGA71379.1 bacterial regulatory s, luxR family protein [Yersinia enterocolitica]
MEDEKSVPQNQSNMIVNSLSETSLISIMEKASIPWAIKDNNSKFVYLNESCLDLFDIQPGFDFEGRLDEEMPCSWSEYSDDFKAHDRKAEQSREGAEIIVTSSFGRERVISPWYFPKFPIYNQNGKVLGTVFFGKKFNFISICDFFNSLKPSVITLTPPVDGFSERELDIIFYAIQKMTAKEIAVKLSLSNRTIENRLRFIYDKVGCHSLKELIEYCHTSGLSHYVPKKVLREGVNFFW